jgi:excinuclease ABC subunit A
MNDKIIIKGATENNLKDIDVTIPKNQLVVITGVSGCGKSSLAFNTIYEEGKRRYMESLSSYARMFLGGSEKPKVVSIDGLCPTIAIEQKTSSHNPRSTVGTVTEIYDYLRLLFARIGVPYCPNGHGQIESLTIKKINEKVLALLKNDDKLIIYAPVASQQKGTFVTEIIDWKKAGFKRIRVDQVVVDLDDEIKLEKNSKHDIEIVIDRILFHHDEQTIERMNASINTAIEYGNQQLMISINDKMYSFSTRHCCKVCGFSIPEIEPRLFSFNSPTGACVDCKGLGYTYVCDPNKLFNMESSINDGGIDYYKNVINTDNLD